MALSGELYYRMTFPELKTKMTKSEEVNQLLTYLNQECSNKQRVSKTLNDQLMELQQLRSILLKSLCNRRRHLQGCKAVISNRYKEVLQLVKSKCAHHTTQLVRLAKTMDANIMDLILSYFEILKREISFNRFNSNGDFTEINGKRKQAELFRNIRYFGVCLNLETSSRVNITSLPPGSTQAKRCMKAVIDNISPSLLQSAGFVGMDVNAVFKLDHSYLSTGLQAAATSAFTGKIKGLFCMISNDNIYNFCVNGISNQYLFESNRNKVDVNCIQGIFRTPWYCFGQPNSDSDVMGTLSARTTTRATAMLKKSFGTAKHLSKTGSNFKLRFSRQCTTSVLLKDLGTTQTLCEDGVFVALCRVLICNMKTVDGSVTEKGISSAFIDGCDTIYCSDSQEYILLNRDNVLPEFIMHVQFKKEDGMENVAVAERVRRSLIKMPTACIQRKVGESHCSFTRSSQQDNDYTMVDDAPRARNSSSSYRNGCAEVFAANAASARQGGIILPNQLDDISVKSSREFAELARLKRLEIEALARSLAEFDSRAALMKKQDIVHAIQGTVNQHASQRRQLLLDVISNKSL